MTVTSLVQTNIVHFHYSVHRAEKSLKRKARRFVVTLLIFLTLAAGFLYVFQTNNITAQGYKISNLQKEANNLTNINKTLQVDVSTLKSMNILEAKSETLNMIKAVKVDYVSLPKASAMLIK